MYVGGPGEGGEWVWLRLRSCACISMFVYEEDCVLLKPSSSPDAQTYVNGQLLSAARTLHHVSLLPLCEYEPHPSFQGDRVVLGGDYFFRFNYPLEAGAVSTSKKGRKDYEFAHTELVKAQNERCT